jgi:hypothetical protein
VPDPLTVYNMKSQTVQPGLYVTFTGTALDTAKDFFGRTAGCGPVFRPPPKVSAALTNLVKSVARNPPDGQAKWWQNPDQARLRDVDGYLSYVAECLGFIDQTEAGHRVLDDLAANKPVQRTVITPGMGNFTFSGGGNAVTTLARELASYKQGGPRSPAPQPPG